jgi:glycine cleavage system aminomethyltransferase T
MLPSPSRTPFFLRTLRAGKRRREAFDFLGGSVIKAQLAEGATKRRVGLLIPTGAPARQHSKILDAAGAEVGEVTSGGFSPCLQKNIAMGACGAKCNRKENGGPATRVLQLPNRVNATLSSRARD